MRSLRAFAVLAALAAPWLTRGDEAAASTPAPPPALRSADSATPPPGSAPPATAAPQQPQQPQPIDVSAPPAPTGQWVYTQQYGWVWMPYGPAYTYVSQYDDYPYQYVFQVGVGWSWIGAPWVYGWGPWPYFGAFGPYAYAWYDWGWWQYPGYGYPGYGYPGRALPPYRPGGPHAPPSMSGGYAPGVAAGPMTGAPAMHGGGGGYSPHGHR